MGNSRWDSSSYTAFTSSISGMSTDEVFSRGSLDSQMNPKGVDFREARDSAANPNATPIIVALDLTGSMGYIADYMARSGLGRMVDEILERVPVVDPAVLIMGVGDASCDNAPLQIGQFESDIKIANWLQSLYLEHGGGGNNYESYDLPYYFANFHTKTDAFEKRNHPGILITIGDEEPPVSTKRDHIGRVIGDTIQADILFSDLIAMTRQMYIPYHIIISEGHYARGNLETVQRKWNSLLGQNALTLSDHKNIAELIVTVLEIEAGRSMDESIGSWGGNITGSLAETLNGYVPEEALADGPRLPRRLDVSA